MVQQLRSSQHHIDALAKLAEQIRTTTESIHHYTDPVEILAFEHASDYDPNLGRRITEQLRKLPAERYDYLLGNLLAWNNEEP